MSEFLSRIQKAAPTASDVTGRRWFYIPYDRLTDAVGPLAEHRAGDCGIVLVESQQKALRRPYHKKKLVLLLANERHFALEQAARGVKVVYVFTRGSFGDGLLEAQRQHSFCEMAVTRPAERELRIDLDLARAAGLRLNELEDAAWLSTKEDFQRAFPNGRSYVMDRFYRAMRVKTGILMVKGKPVGGSYSYDAENRKTYRGEVPVPVRPTYAPDSITMEVIELVNRYFPSNFGNTDGFEMPVTAKQSDDAWRFALKYLLPHFGPFEDAMSSREPELFHSKLSALINLSRLLPRRVVDDVAEEYAKGDIPLASAEGFIRQVLGWREFMRHLHDATDGYRTLDVEQEQHPSDGSAYAGATPSYLGAALPLPAAYWGVTSGLNCLDISVKQVVREGWSHHIQRLMVLSNLATLCGFSPRELTDWFWFAYVDAYDWVVEPNVLGMSTYADGGLTATKPYISGAAYINRMSDYCRDCRFDPKKNVGPDSCPFTALYWTFLDKHEQKLRSNSRLKMPYATLGKKSVAEKAALRERAEQAIASLESVPRPEY